MAIHKAPSQTGNCSSLLQKHAVPILRGALLSLAVIAAAWHVPAQAVVLVSYEFTGFDTGSDAPYAATSADSNVTAGGFTPASGLGTNGNWNGSDNGIDTSTTGNPLPAYAQKPKTASISTASVEVDQTTAFANNSYWSISIDPSTDYQLDLTSLTFDLRTIGTSANRTNFYLSSSIGGYDTPIGSITESFGSGDFAPVSFDLSGASFQNLTDAVEFRLYLWYDTGTGTGSGSSLRFDNVRINGEVGLIPEPSAFAMLAAGLAIQAIRRRRSTAG